MKNLLKLVAAFAISLLAGMLSAQVSITTNQPPYGFTVMTGAERVVAAYPAGAGAATKKVNWSVLSGSATLSATTNALPIVDVVINSANGTCAVTGSVGAYAITSTSDVVLQAQSVDDTSKTVAITFHVCSTSPFVDVEPAYAQAYQGQQKTLQAYVVGYVNEGVTWAIASQPSGGNGTLTDSVDRATRFHATVTGRYSICATSTANGSLSACAIEYVGTTAAPGYATTPNGTEPVLCAVDPAMTGTDYEVGPSQAIANPSTGVPFLTIGAGSTVRFHNEDTTGSAPTQYLYMFQVGQGGTATQPVYICGLPDSSGNLPIIQGSNATQNAGNAVSLSGLGAFKLVPASQGSGQGYGLGSLGPDYVDIVGLHIQNFNPPYTYFNPNGSPGGQYATASGVWAKGGQHQDFEGNDLDNTGWGLLINNNTTVSGRGYTAFVQAIGNHIHNFGNAGAYSFSEHGLYMEAMYPLAEGNLIENPVAGDNGVFAKIRGGESIVRYNTMKGEASTAVIAHPDMSDTAQFTASDVNLGPQTSIPITSVAAASGGIAAYSGPVWFYDPYLNGQNVTVTGCGADNGTYQVTANTSSGLTLANTGATAVTCTGGVATRAVNTADSIWASQSNNITLAQLTQNAEALAKDFVYGNVLSNYYQVTSDQYGSQSAPSPIEFGTLGSTMNDRQGKLYFWNNTVDQPNYVFQTADNSTNIVAAPQATFLSIYAANNAIWNGGVYPMYMNLDSTTLPTFVTNVVPTGAFSLTTPIAGGSGGWGNYSNAFSFPLNTPLDPHMHGLTSGNFIATSSMPYNPVTYAPVGSALVGVGTSLSIPGGFPVSFQPDPINGYMTARSLPLTVGAVESGSNPGLSGITVAPSGMNYAIGAVATFTDAATFANGVTQDVTYRSYWTTDNFTALPFYNNTRNFAVTTANGTGHVTPQVYGSSGSASFSVGGAASPMSIAFSAPNPIALTYPGSTVAPTCTVTFSDSSTQSCLAAGASFGSNNTGAATVNSSGVVTPVGAGSGAITATLSPATPGTDAFTVTATPTPSYITLSNPNPLNLAHPGLSVTPTCIVTYSDSSTLSCIAASATFSSNNTAAATVNSTGTVTPVAAGSGTITATLAPATPGTDSFTVLGGVTQQNITISGASVVTQ